MNTNIQFTTLGDLPKLLMEVLFSNSTFALNNGFAANYDLSQDFMDEITRIEGGLLYRTIRPDQVLSEVETRLKLNSEHAKKCAVTILKEFCGSLAWYFPGLVQALAQLDAKLSPPIFPVAQPSASLAEAIAAIMLLADDMPKHIKPAVEIYVTEVLKTQMFDRAALIKKFIGSSSDGGFACNEDRARSIINLLRDYITVYHFTDVEDVGAPKIDPASVPKTILVAHESADVAEKQTIADGVSSSSLSAQQEAIVEAALGAVAFDGVSPERAARWRTLVEARIRGVRTADKTLTILQAPQNMGGLGLSVEEAARISNILEKTVTGFESKREAFSVVEKLASVAEQTAQIAQGPEEKMQADQRELNERFMNMFGKSVVEEMRKESHREIETRAAAHPNEMLTDLPQLLTPAINRAPIAQVRATVSVAPDTIPPVDRPPAPQLPPRYVPKVPEKLKQLIDAENPILPIRSAGDKIVSIPKKSSDIKQVRRLVGPVDELRIMTLIDFRRLSEDPTVRIQKIRSKIEVVGQDGALEKINAMHAFEQSEPVRLYRDLVKRTLLEGKDISQIISERKAAKIPYLEINEMSALKDFLQLIRYSAL